ncbi:FtsX-like permease family protein [candidate division KSB1 bacterium]|nr:MAG: FtsX-like permease family protein [candidate division KSB1 bacterium]
MYFCYIKSALKSLWKNRFYSGINIIGLAIGIAAVILILLYLQYEASFDRFHKNGKDIYRIDVTWQWEGREDASSTKFLAPVGPTIKAEYPEVEDFTRLRGPFSDYFYLDGKPIKIETILHADSSFFTMLTFNLASGDRERALTDPYSIVLSKRTAKRIFGTEDVIGRTIQTDVGDLYTITAVADDPHVNSSIQFDMLISFSTLYTQPYMHMGWNGGNQYVTFLKPHPHADPEALESKFPAMIETYLGHTDIKFILRLQPLEKIHLFYEPGMIFKQILLFGSIALLILIVAGINFINLSLAQSMKRAKEIGVRKVVGAEKKSLAAQFLTESVLSSLIATLFAVLLVELVFPMYRQLIGRELPDIKSATLCTNVPHRGFEANGYLPEGFDTWKIMWIVYGDEDFLSTFDIQLVRGRNFDSSRPTDKDAYLVNEKLAQSLGWGNPIGKTIQRGGICLSNWHQLVDLFWRRSACGFSCAGDHQYDSDQSGDCESG